MRTLVTALAFVLAIAALPSCDATSGGARIEQPASPFPRNPGLG